MLYGDLGIPHSKKLNQNHMDLSPIYILFNGKIWEDDHKLYGME
jgi:hypothetical protein